MIKAHEKGVEITIKTQIMDANDFNYGGFVNTADDMVHPQSSCGVVMSFCALWCNELSAYYKDPLVYDRILLCLQHLLRVQRPDGTFDNLSTNFYSSPDVAFMMHNLGPAYKILVQYTKEGEAKEAKAMLYEVIQKCAFGIVIGGFHTPNHRWMNSSALMMAYNITKDEIFKTTTEKYLAEGIDCDENGEFTERSPGVYNAINDIALIYIAEEMNRFDLLEHVKRNLDMMFMYYEPDGSIFTQNSRRQDKGYAKLYPSGYYHVYLYMAYKNNDGKYMAMANWIFDHSMKTSSGAPGYLPFYMAMPELIDFEIPEAPIPTDYEIYNPSSGIMRKRSGDAMLTLLQGNSNFLYFEKGGISFSLKMCSSFFAVAQFKADAITYKDGKYWLSCSCYADYRLPFETPPSTSVWDEMDNKSRERVNKLELKYTFSVEAKENKYILGVKTEGCDRVPFKMELCFKPGCVIKTDNVTLNAVENGQAIIKNGDFTASKGNDIIKFSGAFGSHRYAEDMRGSEPKNSSAFTVYFTDFTNVDQELIIEV